MSHFPLRHLSVRVPWHDTGWKGVVCQAPHLNGACVKLKGVAGAKDDERERKIAGRSLGELAPNEFPPCVNERGCFMAPFELEPIKRHALAHMNPTDYGHFQPTPQRYPPYSAGIVPFRWLMRENIESLAREPKALRVSWNWMPHSIESLSSNMTVAGCTRRVTRPHCWMASRGICARRTR